MSRLSHPNIGPDDFLEFGMDLEELRINSAGLQTIKRHAFQYVHGIKRLDFSDNNIGTIEDEAFDDVRIIYAKKKKFHSIDNNYFNLQINHSLISLYLSHGLSSSYQTVSTNTFRGLSNLQVLDMSNNMIRNLPDTCFHFLKKLRKLEMQDNIIDELHKGTFQVLLL